MSIYFGFKERRLYATVYSSFEYESLTSQQKARAAIIKADPALRRHCSDYTRLISRTIQRRVEERRKAFTNYFHYCLVRESF